MENLKKRKKSDWINATDAGVFSVLDFYIQRQYGPRVLNNMGLALTDGTGIDKLTDLIFALRETKWNRLWTDYTAQYNPIWNVDGEVTVTEERNLHQDHTGKNTFTDSGTDTLKHTGTDDYKDTGDDVTKRTGSDTRRTENFLNGFDSSSASPSDSSTETVTPGISETLTHGLDHKNTKDLTDATEYGKTQTNDRDFSDTDEGSVTTTTHRNGNIGVTMTQQMLEADKNYWLDKMSLFYEMVCRDVVDMITYGIYVERQEGTESTGGESGSGNEYALEITNNYDENNGVEIANIDLVKVVRS